MNERGFFLPALPMVAWGAIAAGVVIVGLGIGLRVQTARLETAKAETVAVQGRFDAFVAQEKAAGELAQQAALKKEQDNAKQIKDAVTSRDAALAKLRQSAGTSSGRRDLSSSPTAPAGDSKICLGAQAYTTALAGYRDRLAGILDRIIRLSPEGDAAQIDAQALLAGWPK